MSAVDAMTKRYEGAIAERKREYEAMYLRKAQILKGYNEKVRALRGKGIEIQELIARAKVEGAGDKGLLEILSKWEEANLKIFERHEEEEADMSLLEVAQEEMSKAREAPVKAEASEAERRKEKRRQKAKEDDEMRKYMDELKKKEEDLQVRMAAKE